MPPNSLKSIIALFVLLGLVVPTGAVISNGPVDDVWEQNGIVVAPSDGPNGAYASIDSEGKLAIDVTEPGVNQQGRTVIRNVFVVSNRGESATRVWLTTNESSPVTFYENVSGGVLDRGAIQQRSLHGVEQARMLAPGESISVSVAIDTLDRNESLGPVLLRTLRLHSTTENATTTTTTPTTSTPTTVTVTTIQPTTTTTTTLPPIPDADSPVEIEFANDANVSFKTESVAGEDLDAGLDRTRTEPTAVVSTADREPSGEPSSSVSVGNATVEQVVTEGQPVTLTGQQSLLAVSDRVDRERRVAAAERITVPAEFEERPATVRFRVPRSAFPDTAPEAARVGRRTSDGWQLLDTVVVRETADAVVLQSRTPGFSVFAVFRAPDVTYTWTLPDNSTYVGTNLRTQFSSPGLYNVSLTVRDAAGGVDTTQHRILVNDRPAVAIEPLGNVTPGESVTVHANVTDRFGDTTVSWRLPDGSTARGENVTYTAPAGQHEVAVEVADSFGAETTATRTLGDRTVLQEVATLVGERFRLLSWVGLLGVGLVAVVMLNGRIEHPTPVRRRKRRLVRWLFPWRYGPRITSFATPSWNESTGRFEIPELVVDDPGNELASVEIEIADGDGSVLARKRIDLDTRTRYVAAPEHVPGVPRHAVQADREYVVTVHAVNRANAATTDSRPIRPRVPGSPHETPSV